MPAVSTLTFVGTGEAFDPELPNTSLLYRGSRTLLLDCGYSVPHAFWRVSRDPDLLDGVYITHMHADHSFGLPALLLWMRLAGRTRPLRVFAGAGVEMWLQRLLELGYPGSYAAEKCYPIEPVAIMPEQPYDFGPLRISNAPSNHSVRNLAVRLDDGPTAVCYSGDGLPSEQTRALFSEADVLVHECYADEPGVSGHADAASLLPMASDLGVARLCLLHIGFGSMEDGPRAAVRRRVEGSSWPFEVMLPRPGDVLQLPPSP